MVRKKDDTPITTREAYIQKYAPRQIQKKKCGDKSTNITSKSLATFNSECRAKHGEYSFYQPETCEKGEIKPGYCKIAVESKPGVFVSRPTMETASTIRRTMETEIQRESQKQKEKEKEKSTDVVPKKTWYASLPDDFEIIPEERSVNTVKRLQKYYSEQLREKTGQIQKAQKMIEDLKAEISKKPKVLKIVQPSNRSAIEKYWYDVIDYYTKKEEKYTAQKQCEDGKIQPHTPDSIAKAMGDRCRQKYGEESFYRPSQCINGKLEEGKCFRMKLKPQEMPPVL